MSRLRQTPHIVETNLVVLRGILQAQYYISKKARHDIFIRFLYLNFNGTHKGFLNSSTILDKFDQVVDRNVHYDAV